MLVLYGGLPQPANCSFPSSANHFNESNPPRRPFDPPPAPLTSSADYPRLMGTPWGSDEADARKRWPVKVPIRRIVKIEEPIFVWPWSKDEKTLKYIVKTQADVKLSRRPVPEPPCGICCGGGRVTCQRCRGRGMGAEWSGIRTLG
eukprot:TRINITY_DN1463_c0_g2_i1.p2 TRINITY_DN1463_c0_g2~~TRINITY_DN1463_c0_g2_i1.p2  ORF type:complete len:146 (+),score=12.53 TRINITY_DN1463_c0_g2_i1:509-946(+)